MQINHWTGAAWSYEQYGTHTGTSYEGWSGNTWTELRIPWSEIGDPTGLAICASFSQENNLITTVAWPVANPTGNNVTLTTWWVFAQPPLAGPMPLMGVAPNNPVAAAPDAPVVSIQVLPEGSLRLSWPAVAGALGYRVYALDSPWTDPAGAPLAETGESEIILPADGTRRCYVVTAVGATM